MLAAPVAWGPDLIVLLLVAGAAGMVFLMAREVTAPLNEQAIDLDLSLWSLPRLTAYSLMRGVAAYLLSLTFTLIYGTVAAHNARAEKIMLPLLDVLQAIPVLGFLPGVVLALVALFPRRELGLELACVLMIFTGQVWNMTFSFHASLRGIPPALREAALVQRLTAWQVFKYLELPSAMIGLVWNSMMSMAGGWFFLTVTEAFTLGAHDYRLPGIGSYMSVAIARGNVPAMLGAILAMVIMIVLVDQVIWRPIVVWSQRFKIEESADAEPPHSWVLELVQNSHLYTLLARRLSARREEAAVAGEVFGSRSAGRRAALVSSIVAWLLASLRWGALVLLFGGAAWGVWTLSVLLVSLPLYDAASGDDWRNVLLALLASLARTTAAVLLGAVWTLPAGILIGLSPYWSRKLQPVIQVVASFPAPMLFPLATAAFLRLGIPFTVGCVLLMMLGTQWYILFNTIAGGAAVPADLKEAARVYRLGPWRRWTRLYLPSAFPFFVTGLVTAAGGAWNATIVSEFMPLGEIKYEAFGLGDTICRATASGNYPLLAAAVSTMAVCVVVINRLLWKRLYRMAEERFGAGGM